LKDKKIRMNIPYLTRYFSILVSVFFLTLISTQSVNAQDGEALFKANCTSCHAVKEKVIGPALKGISQRRSEEWLIKWIRNSQAVIKSGDEYAVKLYNDYNKLAMTSFNLKDDEIKAILAYIKTEEAKPDVTAGPVAGNQPGAPPEKKVIWPWLLGAAVILYLLSGILRRVQETLASTVREKQGLPEPAATTNWQRNREWIRRNKKLIAVILIFLSIVGTVKGWYALMDIGVMQGYLPDQPIAYSHTLHAGEMGISCIYCHSGAEKGKVAGVPSANVCMNCHKYVKKGPVTGTEEIAKIYKALDYDPDKGTYGPNPKPIKWVRVHNLPDLAYFNHAQHVVVGKIQCQTCHGPVQDSMTVAYQYSPLTMNWCITCHRQTKVSMAGNAYYNDFHSKMMSQGVPDSLITVEKIGGLECARCHY
jgi:mono/diheme cytochrome c family protein